MPCWRNTLNSPKEPQPQQQRQLQKNDTTDPLLTPVLPTYQPMNKISRDSTQKRQTLPPSPIEVISALVPPPKPQMPLPKFSDHIRVLFSKVTTKDHRRAYKECFLKLVPAPPRRHLIFLTEDILQSDHFYKAEELIRALESISRGPPPARLWPAGVPHMKVTVNTLTNQHQKATLRSWNKPPTSWPAK